MNWFQKWWRRGSLHRHPLCLDFISDRQVCRWSEERKAAVLRRNLEKRINRHAPLFADELIARELAERPDYFQGK